MQNQRCPLAVKAILAGVIYAGGVLCYFLLIEATVTMTPDFQPRFRAAGLILTAATFVSVFVAHMLFRSARL